jgi:hypothetical protein
MDLIANVGLVTNISMNPAKVTEFSCRSEDHGIQKNEMEYSLKSAWIKNIQAFLFPEENKNVSGNQ